MYMHEVKTFLAVAEAGSFLKASRRLFLTPASVMNQVNKLEKEWNITLFTRSTHGLTLTPAGKLLAQRSRKIVAFADKSLAEAHKLTGKPQDTIRVGTSLLRPSSILLHKAQGLPFRFELIPFDESPENLSRLLNNLGNRIDCFAGPVGGTEWEKQYGLLPLGKTPCEVAVPYSHPLAQKESLTWDDLSGESLMLLKEGLAPGHDRLRCEIRQHHKDIHLIDVDHIYDASVFNRCEEENCLLLTLSIWKNVHPSLVTLPMDWNYKEPVGIIYARHPGPAMKQFIEAIKSHREKWE